MRTIVWFRENALRIRDHEPLVRAARQGDVIPLYILDSALFSPPRVRESAHRVQFLLDSVRSLRSALRGLGSDLVLIKGSAPEVLPRAAARWHADRVWAYRSAEPGSRKGDESMGSSLPVDFRLFQGETLHDPDGLRTRSGVPYSVFTPFKKAVLAALDVGPAVPAPSRLPPLPSDVRSDVEAVPEISDLGLTLNSSIPAGGEERALARMEAFFERADTYDRLRNRMDLEGTSRLSADLRFGTVSVRTLWNLTAGRIGDLDARTAFRSQLLWREFAYHILWTRPEVLEAPFKPAFGRFPWKFDREYWIAWSRGRTGYPLIDASARQLLREGFVHNRARMISASFLTKHLLIDYRLGEAHYLKYLVDGDPAQNNLGWQWAAGCGSDAQPYFRVFNPVTQGRRFDPEGAYVRRWIPELSALPKRYLHSPWEAPREELDRAGIRLGKDYPMPIVDAAEARDRFLARAREHRRELREGRQVQAL